MEIKNIQFGAVVSVLPYTAVGDAGWVPPPRRLFARSRVVMRGGGGLLVRALSYRPLEEILSGAPNTTPFFLPITVLSKDKTTRMDIWRTVCARLEKHIARGTTPFGVIIDTTLADLSGTYDENIAEITDVLQLFSTLRVPLGVRFSVLTPPDVVGDIVRLPLCDALFVAESVVWKSLTPQSRRVFFRREKSPFPEDSGFVLGKYIVPLMQEWVRQLRRQGIRKPIVGVGALRPGDVAVYKEAGMSALVLGSALRTLWPWNLIGVARRARKVFADAHSQ